MTDTLVRNERTAPSRMASWTPFRDLLGFDPFESTRGFEYNVTRTENGYEVEVPVPGFKAENVEITFQDEIITVSGKSDRRSFTRSFIVPEEVDPEKIDARVNDGMLVLTLSQRPETQPRRIPVK